MVIALAYEEQVRRDAGDYTRIHLFNEAGESVVTFRDRIVSALLKDENKPMAIKFLKEGVHVLEGLDLTIEQQ